MALDITTVENSLIALVKALITTETPIVAEQDAPRPITGYTTIKIVSILSAGLEESRFQNQVAPDIDLIETVQAQRQLFTSFNFYYDDAMYRANRFRLLINSSASLSILHSAGLGLGQKSEVRELSVEIDKHFEPRAQIDITFHAIDTEDIITRSIATLGIEGEYQEAGRSYDITIETP